jgi:hypothetical protein
LTSYSNIFRKAYLCGFIQSTGDFMSNQYVLASVY